MIGKFDAFVRKRTNPEKNRKICAVLSNGYVILRREFDVARTILPRGRHVRITRLDNGNVFIS